MIALRAKRPVNPAASAALAFSLPAPQPPPDPPPLSRYDRIARIAAYAAAAALTPYAVIKATWVVGSLLGLLPVGAGFSLAGWVVLNTVTIGMAVAGIGVALSLVRPWGMRLPGWPLAFCAWVAVGFLVPVLPFAVLSALLQPDSHPGSQPGPRDVRHQDASMPGWEAALIQIGFIGMGLGLALGLPAYLRRRWPGMFVLRLAEAGGPLLRQRIAVGAAAAVGLFWLSWTAGSPIGVAHPGLRDASWRILNGISGAWALALAVAALVLRRRTPLPLPPWIPATAAWIGSGTLFAWSGWKLALTLYLLIVRPVDVTMPENLGVAAVLHALAVGASATVARALVRGAGGVVGGAGSRNGPFGAGTERDMIAE